MKPYIYTAMLLDDFIERLSPDDVQQACRMLDEFWRQFCEIDVTVLWLVRYTKHDHAAKGSWASLNHKLQRKIESWGGLNKVRRK